MRPRLCKGVFIVLFRIADVLTGGRNVPCDGGVVRSFGRSLGDRLVCFSRHFISVLVDSSHQQVPGIAGNYTEDLTHIKQESPPGVRRGGTENCVDQGGLSWQVVCFYAVVDGS